MNKTAVYILITGALFMLLARVALPAQGPMPASVFACGDDHDSDGQSEEDGGGGDL